MEQEISDPPDLATPSIGRQFEMALLSVDRQTAARLLLARNDDISPLERIERWVTPSLVRIGQGWEQGRVALSQVYMSGRICEELVDQLLPSKPDSQCGLPRTAIAVLEDYHLLGKRIVYSTLRASGHSLRDYGRMSVADLVRRVSEDGIHCLLISTLMLPSALRVAEVRAGLDRLGCQVKIVVGGAPFRFDEQLWKKVGADASGRTASDAISFVDRFLGSPI